MIDARYAAQGVLYRIRGMEKHTYLIIPPLSLTAFRSRLEQKKGSCSGRESHLLHNIRTMGHPVLVQVMARWRDEDGRPMESSRYLVIESTALLREVQSKPPYPRRRM